ncbi:MAG: glutamine--tRNA ligase/YqeY domain fusion protein [Clostridia bacterium]
MEEMISNANFIHDFIDKDLEDGVYSRVQTRFPPEPNGYLHIGHAKAIQINFSTAQKYGGKCCLRLDDTNPAKEDVEYVESIKEDIEWLGYKWDEVLYASSYFDFIYECAVKLIKKGKAFVCDLTAEQMREYRGTLTEKGKDSPYKTRSIEENLDLFQRMTDGEFPDGARVLRAKIDMSSPNMNMRDPIIYRIAHISHHQTGDKWCVYPMYDFAHPLSDAREDVTHSLCSLEFENHRPLYDWFVNECIEGEKPRQIEFARLNLNYCLTSKRKCLKLVNENIVDGWNDPRMATIQGMKRRGYTPAAIRDFISRVGVSKAYSVVDFGLLEACVREDLGAKSARCMAVLRPLKVVIDNYPEDKVEEIERPVNQDKPEMGTRITKFSKVIYIEKEDFMIEPVRKYFRMFPGNEVRLIGAYYVTCNSYELDENGEVSVLHCTYDPETFGGTSPDKRKIKGTLHWVSDENAIDFEANIYDRLFKAENPSDETNGSFEENLNPESMVVLKNCKLEAGVGELKTGDTFQFMRQGYFCVDTKSSADKVIFNRTVALNSSWK